LVGGSRAARTPRTAANPRPKGGATPNASYCPLGSIAGVPAPPARPVWPPRLPLTAAYRGGPHRHVRRRGLPGAHQPPAGGGPETAGVKCKLRLGGKRCHQPGRIEAWAPCRLSRPLCPLVAPKERGSDSDPSATPASAAATKWTALVSRSARREVSQGRCPPDWPPARLLIGSRSLPPTVVSKPPSPSPGAQAVSYYAGMLAYYWLLATPAMGFVFGLYLYLSVSEAERGRPGPRGRCWCPVCSRGQPRRRLFPATCISTLKW
jgi:hypothetical protein